MDAMTIYQCVEPSLAAPCSQDEIRLVGSAKCVIIYKCADALDAMIFSEKRKAVSVLRKREGSQ
jgi:hypothetical protein